jgi:hypothetical protein
VLDSLRTLVNGNASRGPVKLTHIQELDQVASRHFRATQAPAVAISGRHMPLVYKLASNLVSPPHQLTLLIIDLDGRFDATRLSCTHEDARHVYVQQLPHLAGGTESSPADEEAAAGASMSVSVQQLRELVSEADDFFLYSAAAAPSSSRTSWGTIVVGGRKGWLRVEREHVLGFAPGASLEDSLNRRAARQDVVDAIGWTAESPWGSFLFQEEVGPSDHVPAAYKF